MEEVTDEPLYRDRVRGIDIGRAGPAARIRVPSDKDPARRAAETRSFGTTRREVLALADWLRCWQVPAASHALRYFSRHRDEVWLGSRPCKRLLQRGESGRSDLTGYQGA